MADDVRNQEQKIVLDVDDYVKPLKEANDARFKFVNDSIKGLTESAKAFAQHTKQVQAWGQSIKNDLHDFSETFKDNLATGAKALTLGLGTDAIRSSAGAAMDMALEAGKKFAELRSRVSGTEDQFKSWDKTVKDTAVRTKTNLAALQDAFVDLSDSASPEQIAKFMDEIGQATMLNHGDSRGVAGFVKSSLQGQGREYSQGNVADVLGGADLLRRRGLGFGSMGAAMGALGGINQNALAVNKLNDRGVAAMLAGASRATGDAGKSTAAIRELIEMSAKGQLQGLSAQLGGSFRGRDGQFSLANLGTAAAQRQTRLGRDDATSLEIFKQNSGLSADAAEATFKMIRNFEAKQAAAKDAAADTKTLGESATQAGDNLKDTIQQMSTKMVVGFEDILGGFQKPLQSLLSGHVGDALAQGQGAVAQAGAGVAKHPLLVAGALAATAAGGSLISSLASRVLGGGAGGVGGAAGGLVGRLTGKGVNHVWVDNADQIRTGASMSPLAGGSIPGASGSGPAAAAMGFMGKAFAVGAAAEIGIAVGGAINQFANEHASKNKYGEEYNAIEKTIAKLVPEWAGGMTREQYQDRYTEQKVVVEIQSQDPQFRAIPKATDNPRSGRTY